MLSVKQGGINYHFLVFGMTRPGIEPRSPRPLANTLLIQITCRNISLKTRKKRSVIEKYEINFKRKKMQKYPKVWVTYSILRKAIKLTDFHLFFCLLEDCWTFVCILALNMLLLAIVVEGDQKAPFLTASTPRCWGGRYSFPWIDPLYPWYLPYNAEC